MAQAPSLTARDRSRQIGHTAMGLTQRSRLHLVLAGLLLALAALAYLQPGLERSPAISRPLELDPGEVRRIEILAEGKDPELLRRRDRLWYLERAMPIPASPVRIESILALATGPSQAHYRLAPQDAERYGLSPPRLRLRLDGRELAFGDTEPLSGLRYVSSGEELYLMADELYPQLAAGPLALVSRELLPPDARIEGIELPDLRLRRGRDGAWVVRPRRADPGQDAAESLAQHWTHARAYRISVAAEPAPAQVGIRIELAGPQPAIELALIATEPELIFERADYGLRYHLPASAAARLLQVGTEQPRVGE